MLVFRVLKSVTARISEIHVYFLFLKQFARIITTIEMQVVSLVILEISRQLESDS